MPPLTAAAAAADPRAIDLVARINVLRSGAAAASPSSDPGRRLIVAVAGIPGSGKTTLAASLVALLNAAQPSAPSKQPPPPLAIAVPMDGFHLTKTELSTSADPVLFHARRGAPFTFDPTALLILLRRIRYDSPHETIPAPAFSHATGDPVAGAIQIAPHHRVVVVEGLYLLADVDPWCHIRPLCDLCYWLDVDLTTARERVVVRHIDAGLASTRQEAEMRWELNDQLNAAWVLEHSVR
ncbi:hypothetical protein HDU89_004679 [Geranomyces variabilis]|nr:hypothetical protein HDU89_004679 [Geranomyces variabilis]